MKPSSIVSLFLLLLAVGLVAGDTVPASAGPAPAALDLQPAAGGECFPVDECNVCCRQPNGQLICTNRACS